MTDPAPEQQPAKHTRLKRVGIGVGGVALLMGVATALQIEDWSRDLTRNHAATAPDAADERLRPIETTRTRAEAVAAVKEAAQGLSRWELSEESSEGGTVTLHYVRTTALFRFQDDIHVRVTDAGAGKRRVEAESRSRVGKGDLGQNPRNLRALLEPLRKALAPGH